MNAPRNATPLPSPTVERWWSRPRPDRARTDTLARLSALAAWWVESGVPGELQLRWTLGSGGPQRWLGLRASATSLPLAQARLDTLAEGLRVASRPGRRWAMTTIQRPHTPPHTCAWAPLAGPWGVLPPPGLGRLLRVAAGSAGPHHAVTVDLALRWAGTTPHLIHEANRTARRAQLRARATGGPPAPRATRHAAAASRASALAARIVGLSAQVSVSTGERLHPVDQRRLRCALGDDLRDPVGPAAVDRWTPAHPRLLADALAAWTIGAGRAA